jgi:hypothetical protein
MKKPTTDEARSEGLELEAAPGVGKVEEGERKEKRRKGHRLTLITGLSEGS